MELKKNIERSGRIMGELVDGGSERVTNTHVRCPCCEKRIGLTCSGLLTGLINHLIRSTLKEPQEKRSRLLGSPVEHNI